MNEKIILVELEKLLFPERYPYFNSHFETEVELLRKNNLSVGMLQNIKFKLKIVRYSLNIKDQDSRNMLNYIFEKHIDAFYDWRREYDWQELKSILFYFMVFSQAKSPENIFTLLDKQNIQVLFKKYFPKQNSSIK